MNVQEQSKMDNNIEIMDNTEETPVVADVQNVENTLPGKTSRKRVIVGKVISDKGDKTITVASVRQVIHPLYKKYYKVTKKVMAHDENNDCHKGDTVKIIESRPLSARKRWNLVEVLVRAK